ncbi:MAG: electron transfer flavoprotein subunit alpha/FixB family protein [Ignavibacteria bacterium]|nr:electron transfer flavoprotein subunit alpha/FixB family protein [Ignavibacteria bacterium]MBI3765825.1 electron transfer flavoprotein subunit alpha/FixB family protein [Ignavibacteriales bacterium]
MKILAFAEQREGKFKKSAFEVTQAARRIADKLTAELITLVIGDNIEHILPELRMYGANRVLAAQDTRLQYYSTTAYAKIVAQVAQQEQAMLLFLPASQMGKDLAPRIAAKLSAGVAADSVALRVENGDLIATRPVYAGKAMIDVRITSPIKLFTLRPNVFTAVAGNGAAIAVEKVSIQLDDVDFAAKVTGVKLTEGRPDVTEASIIVSGGRGLKGPENFHLVEKLADVLGAAVGASRAVVDAGWRPHDEQVGQTGKTVSPTLYIACGISGAVQHLAGMSTSKYIVAINKDKDAPIFQVADYGVVADVFEILPTLTEELKKTLGK